MKTYLEYIAARNAQNEIVDILSKKLNQYPKDSWGLVSDDVKSLPEFIEDKIQFNKEFKKLQEINKEGVKKFKKDIQQSSKDRRKRVITQ